MIQKGQAVESALPNANYGKIIPQHFKSFYYGANNTNVHNTSYTLGCAKVRCKYELKVGP